MPPVVRFFASLPLWGSLLLLADCALIDQTTFYPPPRKPVAVAAPAPAAPANDALLTITLTGGQPDYQDALAEAVKQALAVKPDVTFQVVSLVPQTGATPPSWDDAEKVTVWGRRVADQIQADGVQQGQISLGAKASPGLDHGEIRVYVQ